MARRQSRLTKSGSTARAGAFETRPSGSTIGKNLITATAFAGNVNFGQGQRKIYGGVTPIGTAKTALSAGTVHLLTGLTTVVSFQLSFRYGLGASATTPADGRMLTKWQWEPSGKAGGATLYFQTANGGATKNLLLKASGSSMYWLAIGT